MINTARAGDGGRKLALHDLITDNVDLTGIDLTNSNLNDADLRGGKLMNADLSNALVYRTDFSCKPQVGEWIFSRAFCAASPFSPPFWLDPSRSILAGVKFSGQRFEDINF